MASKESNNDKYDTVTSNNNSLHSILPSIENATTSSTASNNLTTYPSLYNKNDSLKIIQHFSCNYQAKEDLMNAKVGS